MRPEGFDLTEAWRSTVAAIEERRTVVRAVILVPAQAVPWLRGQFGRALEVGATRPDERVEVRVGGSTAEMVAQQLTGWGSYLQVIGPDEVRDELARIGRELVALHGPEASRTEASRRARSRVPVRATLGAP